MATMVKLLKGTEEIVDETYRRINEAEESRPLEFKCVVKIQAWYRAGRVRAYVRHLNHCATQVQRRWRGYLGRKYYRELLKRKVFIMKLNYYNALATKVQKVWRGYYTRKYVSNYYSRQRYLEGLKIKNEIVRRELGEFSEQQTQMRLLQREEEEKAKLDNYAKHHRYLLSTKVIPGVYNSPYQPYPYEIEQVLKETKPVGQPARKQEGNTFDPAWKRYDLPQLDPLPPIAPKPQGPFRDPREVQKQRYKPFQPSLRVATDFYSLEQAREGMKQEEWMTRINDSKFLPFSHKSYPTYEPLLHTNSKYGHLSYGTQYYREEFPDNFLIPKTFQTTMPPIPIFEKLNDTYSQGQV